MRYIEEEQLDGLFRTPGQWGINPTVGEHRLGDVHIEVLAVFDHDYEGTHALLQCWDHSDPDPEWQYILWQSFNVTEDWPPAWERGWQTKCQGWWEHPPSYTVIGELIDMFLMSPPVLRYLAV
jgi:hypothetical protein